MPSIPRNIYGRTLLLNRKRGLTPMQTARRFQSIFSIDKTLASIKLNTYFMLKKLKDKYISQADLESERISSMERQRSGISPHLVFLSSADLLDT